MSFNGDYMEFTIRSGGTEKKEEILYPGKITALGKDGTN
jgi:hypothetical protein